MKIRKLHIKNYKVFDDLELDFTDANGNTLDKIVLAGVNGCGKTTVLEVIHNLYANTFPNQLSAPNKSTSIEVIFEVTELEKLKIQYFFKLYKNNDNDNDNDNIDIKTAITNFLEELKSKNYFTLVFEQNYDLPITEIISTLIFQSIQSHPSRPNLFYFPINTLIKKEKDYIKILHLGSDKDEMKKLALKDIRDEVFKNEDVTIRESKEKAIKRLQKPLNGLALNTKLVDLASEELIFESPNGEKIKFEELSNGEQNLYFRAIYLSMLNPQNSIIMIDEPEDSLHPTWQQKVMQLYQNIGENNQVIVATHSPHIIGSSKTEEVFLLEIEDNKIGAVHPRYTKGHSIDYILEEMGANPRDTSVIKLVDDYLALMRKGLHETEKGLKLKASIDALDLDPNSEEMMRLDLSIKRFKAIGV